MPRFFNTTGPCEPTQHYMVSAEVRLPALLPFIERQQYVVLHAPRQTGKTTAMRAFAQRLRERGIVGVWATLEESQGLDDVERAEPVWIHALARAARHAGVSAPEPGPYVEGVPSQRLSAYISAWAEQLDVPLVLLLDEADVVRGAALISLLRQLRAGFMDRGVGRFATSIVLIGLRDLRDYVTEAKDGTAVNPGSPFNIKAGSFTLRLFSHAEVAQLLGQHSEETGQSFTDEAIAEVFRLTQGQPYLVNALADDCVTHLVPDRSVPVSLADVEQARDRLILARTTHLDSLAYRLREPRVASVIEAIVLGDKEVDYASDDFEYVVDLGLIAKGPNGAVAANPLYKEVLARQISYNLHENLRRPWWPWSTVDGRLDFPALMDAFRQWWRENADVLHLQAPRFPEAFPHLALMAFVQRVVNGGGRVHREFAAGRGALDLLIEHGSDRFVVEVKRVRERDGLERQRERGVEQVLRYMDTVGVQEGWLLLFDVREGRTWEQRLWADEVCVDGRTVHILGA